MTDSPRVAYFCMEYGLDDRLKTYSGGLGILAGDILKAAHDLGVPMVGLGIRWKQGYTRQLLDADGRQVDAYRSYAVDDLLEDTGVEVTVRIKGADVRCKVWKADRFGNVPLYLLDTDLPGNPEHDIGGGNDGINSGHMTTCVGNARRGRTQQRAR